MAPRPAPPIMALVLAGGGATRLGGGDKPLRPVGGVPILARILDRLRPQADRIAISANGDLARLAGFGLPVIADAAPPRGPLSGVLAGLDWLAREDPEARLLTVAGDTPFPPPDLAARLAEAAGGSPRRVAVAASGSRRHPVFALWPATLRDDLARFLDVSPTYSVAAFLALADVVQVDFPPMRAGERDIDPFFNVNTPQDLAAADEIAQMLAS